MNFETLCNTVGYWAAVRMTLTFIGVDFITDKDAENSLIIQVNDSRFVLWHNDQGCMELDIGMRRLMDLGHRDIRIAKGIQDTFQLLCDVRQLMECEIVFDQIVDSY